MKFADTIKPKSDQLNADDFVGNETKIITVTKVAVSQSQDQPASIYYEGDNGKPWKPCKTMRKLIGHAWGLDELAFVGRSLELYRDTNVTWGGEQVGGIRVKAMTDLTNGKPLRVALQTSKTKRQIYTVEPLTAPVAKLDKQREKAELFANNIKQMLAGGATWEAIESENTKALERLKEVYPELYHHICGEADLHEGLKK